MYVPPPVEEQKNLDEGLASEAKVEQIQEAVGASNDDGPNNHDQPANELEVTGEEVKQVPD